jgi:DNA-binding CsgD family transcriptional regulator
VLVFLIALEWLAGHWERARWHAAAALELAEEARDDRYRAWVLYNEALVLANLGAVGAARAGAEEAATIAEAVMDAHLLVHVRGLLGHLALAAGDAEAACRILRELPPLLLAAPFTGLSPIWPDAIESLLERGEREEASALLEAYERMAQHASAGLRALAGRSRGLLEAVDGNLDGALATMGEALCLQEGAAYPFERGRTLLHLGRLRRRAGRKRAAREALAEALVLFERLGADGWATRTRAELARISGRRPGSAELTDAEARVASLAVTGLTNKEIAAALFVTVHTVEAHLSQVYRKLGVHSRTELGARLLASDGGAAKPAEPAAKD